MEKAKFIDPEFLIPHYSTKLIKGYYNFLVDHFSKDIFYEICEELKVPPEFLMADNNWFSHSFYLQFLKKVKDRTGDPDIAENVGRTLLSSENINPFEVALLKIMFPFVFYLSIPFSASKVNRRSRYKILKFFPGKFVFQIISEKNTLHDPDTCRNACGAFKAPQEFFGLDSLNVIHDECVHKGAERCVFEVKYSAFRFNIKKIVTSTLFFGFGFLTYKFAKANFDVATLPLLALISYFSIVGFGFVLFKSIGIFKFHTLFYQQNKVKEQKLYDSKLKLDRRYHESNLLRDLSLRLVTLTTGIDVIKSCLTDLEKRFGYERILMMLMGANNSFLYTADVRGFHEHTDMLFKLNFKYPSEKNAPEIFANILERGECRLIEDIDSFRNTLEPQNQLLIKAFGVKSLIVSPIQDTTSKYGLLVIGAIGEDRRLTAEDKHLIESISRMLALFFQNARNFEKERTLRALFQKYVPPVVIDGIRSLESGQKGYLVPKNNAVTSMFVDLRSFTRMSEAMAPERVVEMLNLYIEHVTDCIAKEGGIIDNLVGDGIVAFFPAKEDDRSEHAQKALKAAIRVLGNLDQLNHRMKEKGYPNARLGIGMHSGNATVGNLGSDRKMNYTAIGDTINLASRLESLCKDYSEASPTADEGILIFTESVFNRARLDIPFRELGTIKVRGRIDGAKVFMIDKEMAMSVVIENIQSLSAQKSDLQNSRTIELGPLKDRRAADRRKKTG